MKRLSLYFLLLSIITYTYSQTNLDSLYAVWEDESQADSNRVAAYKSYIWDGYLFSKPDSAIVLAEALHKFGASNKYAKAQATAYNLQGVTRYLQGDYVKALDYYHQSLVILEQLNDQLGIATNMNNTGIIYHLQGDYAKALDYYKKSLEVRRMLDDSRGVADNLNNIGILYREQEDYALALIYATQCLSLYKELGDRKGIAACLNNLGIIYKLQGDYANAIGHYEQGIAIQEQLGDQKRLSGGLTNIGILCRVQGDYSKALSYCNRAYKLAVSTNILFEQKAACECLYDTYKEIGNSKQALKYFEKKQGIEDSLKAEETSKKLQAMEFAKEVYADSLKKVEEARLIQEAHEEEVAQKNKTRNMLIGVGLIALLLAGGLYSRNRYVRKSRDAISQEKERSENLLLNILPEEIANELKEKGEADARDFEQVSILFTDFKEFTQLSEKLSAKDLVAELNYCFKGFDAICEKHGVEKIKTLGDSYMAAGGLPVPKSDSTHRLIRAALEMTDFVLKRQKEKEAQGQIPFEMRAGIHTGHVVAGIVGVKKFQYDIWGDTVNTASRMESHGEVGKVNISQTTYNLVMDDAKFSFEHRGKVSAKGKGEVDMYFVELA